MVIIFWDIYTDAKHWLMHKIYVSGSPPLLFANSKNEKNKIVKKTFIVETFLYIDKVPYLHYCTCDINRKIVKMKGSAIC